MNEDFKNAFKNLNIHEKRNQISNEIIIISELIKTIETKFNYSSSLNPKNYNINKNSNMSESEMLLFLYEDIYNIEKELLTLLNIINI